MQPLQNYEKFINIPSNTDIIPLALPLEQYSYNKLLDKSHKELVSILTGVTLARLIQQKYNTSRESVTTYILRAIETEEVTREVFITKILQLHNNIRDQNPEIQVQELLDSYDPANSDYYEIDTLTSILEESIYFQENSHESQQNPESMLIKFADNIASNILSDPNQMKNLEELIVKSGMILSEDCYAFDIEQTTQIMNKYLKLHEIKYPNNIEEREVIKKSITETLKSLRNILNNTPANDVQSIINDLQNIYIDMINKLELPEYMHLSTQQFTFSIPYKLHIENIEEFGANCLNEILPIAMCYSPNELKTTIELLEYQLGYKLKGEKGILLPEFSKDPRTMNIRYMIELILAIYEHKPNIEILPPDESRFEDYNIYEIFYEKEFAFTGKHIYVAMSEHNQGRN